MIQPVNGLADTAGTLHTLITQMFGIAEVFINVIDNFFFKLCVNL